MDWFMGFIAFVVGYLCIGLSMWRLIARSSRPRGAAWAIILWPLWLVPRSS